MRLHYTKITRVYVILVLALLPIFVLTHVLILLLLVLIVTLAMNTPRRILGEVATEVPPRSLNFSQVESHGPFLLVVSI